MHFEPVLQYRGRYILGYWQAFTADGEFNAHNRHDITKEKSNVKGQLSLHSQKKIKKILTLWLTALQFHFALNHIDRKYISSHVTFCTLTLPSVQKHSDREVKRQMLNRFLLQVQRWYGVKSYLWKAEAQDNGNIHFHIVLNKYVHYLDIRFDWNIICGDNGYIEPFKEKFGHGDPNSTDIHGLERIDNPAEYICKYMEKTKDKRLIDGKIWGCSDNLLKLHWPESFSNITLHDLGLMCTPESGLKLVVKDTYFMVFGKVGTIMNRTMKDLASAAHTNLKRMYNMVYRPERILVKEIEPDPIENVSTKKQKEIIQLSINFINKYASTKK